MVRFILVLLLLTSCTTRKNLEPAAISESPNVSEARTADQISGKRLETSGVSEVPPQKKTFFGKPKVAEKPKEITKGMSKAMVLRILGQPRAGTGYDENVKVLHYIKYDGGGTNYFFVRLVEGKVESFGPETPAVEPFKPVTR